MASEKEIVYLAALLHDIGKFYQRADPNGAGKSTLLSADIKNLEPSIAPKHWQSQKYTHKHVLWTAQFFENMQKHFNQYLKLEDGWTYDKLLRLSATHHNPTTGNLLERIIQKADHYSSGIDRDIKDGEGWKDAAEEADSNWDAFKRTRMRSVFEGVSLKEDWPKANAYRKKLPLVAISTDDNYFPIDTGTEESKTDYSLLWKQFEGELKFIQSKTIRSFNDSLQFLLEKYTSRIPSSTQHLPDVSLFDHLKTTAAFAISLKAYIDDKKLATLPSDREQPFALVGGALSGIQKFIYGIVAKGAAKNLKGRSFYLQLLVDNVVQILLDELLLQNGNVIYASGGGFYLIAPNTSDLPEKLKIIEKRVTEKLFDYHGTELYLALDFAPFGEEQIFKQVEDENNIGAIWKAVSEKLSKKKARRFGSLFKDNFELFFTPQKVSPEKKKDSITGDELGEKIKYLDDKKEQPVNEYTWKQIKLGEALKKANYWILAKERLSYFPEGVYWLDPIGLGLHNYLVDETIINEFENQLRTSADNVRVIHFNKENFLEPLQKGINNVYGFTWYGGNDFAENEYDEPKTFEELAGITLDGPNHKETSKRKAGPELTRLGVLRMDVDNLGAIFRRGLAPNRRSFSRYSTLSRSLDWFFKGYLNTIWKDNPNYSEYSQIIYSGGDDLFIVGKWDFLISMAADIQAAFKRWVCENPELTISGGMASVGPRFPILKSASYSEVFEKAAKKHKFNNQDKNAFAFIAYTPQHSTGEQIHSTDEIMISLNWETEYPYLKKLKEELTTLMKMKDGLSEGFSSAMYNLLQQARMEMTNDGKFYPKNHRVTWLAAYQFKRSSDGKSEVVKDFFKKWGTNIMTGKVQTDEKLLNTGYHSLQLLALAARWAALEERSKI